MIGVPPSDLDTYFAEASSWNADKVRAAERSRKLAWLLAAASGVLAVASIFAVAALSPLKTVEPFVVRVDQTTGAVDIMTALTSEKPLTYDEAVTKHFLAQYVRAREGYLDPAAEESFALVSILSGATEQRRWADLYRGSNPASPQNLYGPEAEAVIAIRAIGFINEGVANVRFHRSVRQAQQIVESDWIATIAFTYTRAPMSEPDRLRNPLGFQVTSYRADPEVVR